MDWCAKWVETNGEELSPMEEEQVARASEILAIAELSASEYVRAYHFDSRLSASLITCLWSIGYSKCWFVRAHSKVSRIECFWAKPCQL